MILYHIIKRTEIIFKNMKINGKEQKALKIVYIKIKIMNSHKNK
jgi:hypothetical protein